MFCSSISLRLLKVNPSSHYWLCSVGRVVIHGSLGLSMIGIKAFSKKFPNVKIVTAEIDQTLSNTGICLPGIGEFGDRYFGTE